MGDPYQPEKEEKIKKDDSTSISFEETQSQTQPEENTSSSKNIQRTEKEDEYLTEIESVKTEVDKVKISIADEIKAFYQRDEVLAYRDTNIFEICKESGSRKKQRKGWVFKSHQKAQQNPPEEWKGYGYPPKTVMAFYPQAEPIGQPISYSHNRNKFVRLVFSICGAMLLYTVIYVYICISTNIFRAYMKSVIGLITFIFCWILSMMVSYVYCCSSCSRFFPVNAILNVIVTIAMSYICGFLAIRYAPYIVLCAAGTTLGVVIVCIGLALTSIDFTKCILIVIVAMAALAIASLICFVLSLALGIKLSMVRLVILIISSVVMSVMLIIELQMILGGKSVELGEEEYTFGAYMIYNSIIDLFITFLRIFGMTLAEGGLGDDYDD